MVFIVSTVSSPCILRKPKTKRSKRFLESRAPKLTEDVKSAMIMKGGNTSLTITQALKDIVSSPMKRIPVCHTDYESDAEEFVQNSDCWEVI